MVPEVKDWLVVWTSSRFEDISMRTRKHESSWNRWGNFGGVQGAYQHVKLNAGGNDAAMRLCASTGICRGGEGYMIARSEHCYECWYRYYFPWWDPRSWDQRLCLTPVPCYSTLTSSGSFLDPLAAVQVAVNVQQHMANLQQQLGQVLASLATPPDSQGHAQGSSKSSKPQGSSHFFIFCHYKLKESPHFY